jgi:hypothetical protein
VLYLLPSNSFTPDPYSTKILTYLRLWKLGCPVLKSAVLTNKQDLEQLDRVISHLNSDICTLRFQYTKPCSSPIRGGNAVAISKHDLEMYWSSDRFLWPMEPTNRLSNRYGINIGYFVYEDKIIFEIVGQGFDVADINRGYITPHQRIQVRVPEDRSAYGEIWKGASINIVSQEKYYESVSTRKLNLAKMGLKVHRLQFPRHFKPISLRMLERVDRFAQRIFESYNYAQDVVTSCSILQDDRVIFWDIQTGENKYAALYKNESP